MMDGMIDGVVDRTRDRWMCRCLVLIELCPIPHHPHRAGFPMFQAFKGVKELAAKPVEEFTDKDVRLPDMCVCLGSRLDSN